MNYIIFLLILLSSVGFYNPWGIFSVQMQKLIFYFFCIVGIGYSFFFGKSLKETRYPRVAYSIVLLGIVTSIFMAILFHPQSLRVSITTTMAYFLPYALFYVFLKLDVDPDRIMKAIIVLTFISGVTYICNMTTAPNMMFGLPLEREDLSRGILRLPIVYIELFPLPLFYAIVKYNQTRKKIWLAYAVYVMIIIFLSVTRQTIFLSFILGSFLLFKKLSLLKKVAFIGVMVVFVTATMPHIPVYKTMLELSKEQKDKNEDKDDIRITAWEFYTTEFQTNSLSYFLGNGVPAYDKSEWGKEVDSITDTNKCFAVDVGWAGFYFYFGIFTTLALLWLMVSGVLARSPNRVYPQYWLLFAVLTCVASGIIVFWYIIIDVSLALYLAYAPERKLLAKEEIALGNPKPDSSQNGYPQLRHI